MEDTPHAPPNRRENLRRTIMARRQARGRHSPVKVEQSYNRRSELTSVELEKKERRREQNRRAAQRCRTKKRLTQYNVIKNLERIVEHNRHLQKEVQQLRWDKGELHRKWIAHRKLCPCFQADGEQPDLESCDSTLAIKTEPISDEEDTDGSVVNKIKGEDGQENEMDLSFASMASVLCSSPIAGFPKIFPGISDISAISEESLTASLCGEVMSCSPSALEVMETPFLQGSSPSSIPKKEKTVPSQQGENRTSVSSQRQLFVETSQASSSATAPVSGFHHQSSTAVTVPASANMVTTVTSNTFSTISSRCVNSPPAWQFVPSPNHHPAKFSPHSSPSSCMFSGQLSPQPLIPHTTQDYSNRHSCQPNFLQHLQISQQPEYHTQHQGFPFAKSLPHEKVCQHTQYSDNHASATGFPYSAAFSLTSSTNAAAGSSPLRQQSCTATNRPQTPKSLHYPDLCRLLQPHPSPAQVVPSISTSACGDRVCGSRSTSATSAMENASNIFNAGVLTAGTVANTSQQSELYSNQARPVLANGGSTPDTMRASRRERGRSRCSSDSVYMNPSGNEVLLSSMPRDGRSTETPDIDNDDVFTATNTSFTNATGVNFSSDSNNNSSLVSDNNSSSSSNTNNRSASTSELLLYGPDSISETSSVLEGVRHLISLGTSSCSNTPNSITSDSSICSEVDDLIFDIPSDALLFFGANSEVDSPHAVYPEPQ
ncbi:transcription factor kayak [Plakobranchus ocellatus]|uniref:Transcription factor kayak n=1 Tax=Plakobranchus ocellatus TaxID=259542 RepID=A0AAV3ZXP2_9GAST|nr:transcription factor kayak [Plakobranchus ocellatus]